MSMHRTGRAPKILAGVAAAAIALCSQLVAMPAFADDATDPVDPTPVVVEEQLTEPIPAAPPAEEPAPPVEATAPVAEPPAAPTAAPTAEAADPAPAVVVLGDQRVELRWLDRSAEVPGAVGYQVRVYHEDEETALAEHALADADPDAAEPDEHIARVTEPVGEPLADGELAVTIDGLSAATDYRFTVAVLAADDTVLAESERSEPVRTLDAPPAGTAPSPSPSDEPVQPAPGEPGADDAVPTPEAGDEQEQEAEAGDGSGPESAAIAPIEAFLAAGRTAPLLALAALPATAPRVTVRGATAVEVDFGAIKAAAGMATPGTATVEVYDAEESLVKTQGLVASLADTGLVTGLAAGTTYTIEIELSGYDADFNELPPVTSERSAPFTTRASIEAPGVIPDVPTLEPTSGSQIMVSWAPVETGGEVRTYTVRLYHEGGTLLQTKTGINPFTGGTFWTFTGLDSQTGYTATVQAIGYEIGTPQLNGAESAKSAVTTTLKGVPAKPGTPVLTAGAAGTTDVVASWTAPADGGYPIGSYLLEFYTSASVSTGGNIAKFVVPGDTTSVTVKDATFVGAPFVAVVSAYNQAGVSSRSGYSDTATAAKTPVKPTATPSTAVATGNTASGIQLTNPTGDGFTLTWTTQASPNAPVAGTGYLVRVIEHLPSNGASSTSYTYRPAGAPEIAAIGQINAYGIIDLGTGFATTGRPSATITGLAGGRTYRVSITQYVEVDGVRTYRTSSGASTASIVTTGSSAPSAGLKAAAPVATGVDSLSWTGTALAPSYWGGSDLTGYRVALYLGGQNTPLQVIDATVTGGLPSGAPSAVFTGLTRGTAYEIAVAGVNANGVGEYSERSAPVSTLLRPVPGSVPPPYASLAELHAAIAAGDVDEIATAEAGITGPFESNAAIRVELPWTGTAEPGEVWVYAADGAPFYQAEFAVSDGIALLDDTLGDLDSGDYVLAFYPETGTPVAVEATVLRPAAGRTELDDAVFRWGINNESNKGAFYGGCNYFVAGKAPDVGASQVFGAGRYSAEEGDVTIVKPNAAGVYETATFATKCLTRYGATVTSSVTSAATESQIVISAGSGWVDPSTNSADIQWDGDFTVVYYGGLTYWYGSDPHLVVEDGVGSVTITASGYGADMNDETKWIELAPREITLANLTNVKMTTHGFTATPSYLGVAVDIEGGAFSAQVPQTPDNAAYWGSFPQDFVEF